MAEPSLELALQLLRQMQLDLRDTKETAREILRRVSNLERLAAERVDRIARRLEPRGSQPTQ